jgi:hypothetical protein
MARSATAEPKGTDLESKVIEPLRGDGKMKMGDASEMFETWWARVGKSLDPDTSDVSWFDKRKSLAEAAFVAAMAQSRNYVCDKECEPTEALFANGREIWIRQNEDGEPFLHIEQKVSP